MTSFRSIVLWGLRITLTVAFLVYLFGRIPLADVARSLRSADMALFFLSLAGLFFQRFLGVRRMRHLTRAQGMSLSTGELFEIGCVSSFYGLVLPGSLSGGIVRWYKLSRHEKQAAGALTAIAVDRLADVTGLVGVGCLCWLISAHTGSPGAIGIGLVAALAVLMTLLGVALNQRGSRLLLDPVRRLNWSFLPGPARAALSHVAASVRQYHGLPGRFFLAVLGLSLAAHVAGTLSFTWLANSLGLRVPIETIGWIQAYVVLLTMLPLSVSGLGVREGALVFLLAPYGVAGADAVALSFLRLFGTLLIGVVGGAYELRRLALRR